MADHQPLALWRRRLAMSSMSTINRSRVGSWKSLKASRALGWELSNDWVITLQIITFKQAFKDRYIVNYSLVSRERLSCWRERDMSRLGERKDEKLAVFYEAEHSAQPQSLTYEAAAASVCMKIYWYFNFLPKIYDFKMGFFALLFASRCAHSPACLIFFLALCAPHTVVVHYTHFMFVP